MKRIFHQALILTQLNKFTKWFYLYMSLACTNIKIDSLWSNWWIDDKNVSLCAPQQLCASHTPYQSQHTPFTSTAHRHSPWLESISMWIHLIHLIHHDLTGLLRAESTIFWCVRNLKTKVQAVITGFRLEETIWILVFNHSSHSTKMADDSNEKQ